MEDKKIRIGLDIGVSSVGWSVVDCDEKGEPIRIVDLGARVFDVAEVPKTGAALAEERRLARGNRRRLRRKAERLSRIKKLFENNGVTLNFEGPDVYELRAKALDEKISENDFARVLYTIAKNRGFKSNRKSEAEEKDGGALISAAKRNQDTLSLKGYRTIGEMIVREYKTTKTNNNGKTYDVYDVHNHGGSYDKTVYRDLVAQEIKLLFEQQNKFGNKLATDEVRDKYVKIFGDQRNFDEGPGKGSPYSADYKVGKCLFEDEDRAPKASYSVELSVALQKLNNIKVVEGGVSRELTPEERAKVRALIDKQAKVTYSNVRKALGLGYDSTFNISYSTKEKDLSESERIDKVEKKTIVSNLENSRKIRKCLSQQNQTNDGLVDEIAVVLTLAKSDSKRREYFDSDKYSLCKSLLTDGEIDALLSLTPAQFGMLSLTATRNILPFLEEGKKYSEACECAGYNHSVFAGEKTKLLNTAAVREQVESITSPVVKRAISQSIRVVNALIKKYGSPIAINVELAREMSKNHKERNEIKAKNDANRDNSDRIQNEFIAKFGRRATGIELIKYKLYEEQGCKCIYSGKEIDVVKMLAEENAYQVDHVIPYSRSFNDSYNNKVLVLAKENQRKGNRLPYEYMTAEEYAEFEARVNCYYSNNYQKKKILLTKKVNEDEWKSRALNDTRYISRFMADLLRNHLLFDESALKKKRVFVYNGVMTDYARKRWGIAKVREDGDFHHAVDATVIACMTDSMRNKIERYHATHELAFLNKDEKVDMATGEIVTVREILDGGFPEPYVGFRKELVLRCSGDVERTKEGLKNLGYTDEQLAEVRAPIASREPRRKKTGQIHEATVYSAKYFDEQGVLVSKTPLNKLKLTADGKAIEGYFNPSSDRLLYNELLTRLQQADGKAEKAFADPVYKPMADGTPGHIVKKVKIESKFTTGVFLDKVKGFAKNGEMHRVDVFKKDGKYYCVPVYMSDVYKGVLPNKAATAGKSYAEWPEMDETYKFQFSMYKNDLLCVEHKKGITMKKIRKNDRSKTPDEITIYKDLVYFNSFNISVASALVEDVLGCYSVGIGLKTLTNIQKCQVDTLGNVTIIKEEKRQPLK